MLLRMSLFCLLFLVFEIHANGFRPEKPLKWLAEYLARRSAEIEGGE